MTDETLCDLTAVELRRLLGAADVSAREVLDSHLSRIDRVNPLVNALVTIVPEIAAERALEADEKLARGEPLGLLHGFRLPTRIFLTHQVFEPLLARLSISTTYPIKMI